jgi:hypothetical protein
VGHQEYQVNADIMLTDTLAVPLVCYLRLPVSVINNRDARQQIDFMRRRYPAPKIAKTSGADSILSEKDFKPF